MPSRELKTLLKLKFAGTRVGVRNHGGVRAPRVLVTVNFAGRPAAVWHRMIYAPIRARAANAVGVLPLRGLTAVDARIG